MKRRGPPIKPFVYGKFIIEYKDKESGLPRFIKEYINNYEDAEKIKESLLAEGVVNPVIKKVG